MAGSDPDLGSAKPSRESMREVKQEARQRRRDEKARQKSASRYWAGQTGAPSRRRVRSILTWVAVAAVLAAMVWVAYLVTGGPSRLLATGGTDAANPTSAPDASEGATPEAAQPFEGSPAVEWRVGAKGIRAPDATQVGVYTPHQVKAAYKAVKAYLSAAMLDEDVLFDSKLKPVLRTMNPYSRTQITAQVQKGKKSPDDDDAMRWYDIANRFHPGDWTADDEVRVRGKMRASVDDEGRLQVDYTYVAAYWLAPATSDNWEAVAVRRQGTSSFEAAGGEVSQPYIWGDGVTTSHSVCGSDWPFPQYLEVWPDPGSVDTASRVPGPAADLSDPDASLGDAGCFTDTSGF